MFFVCFADAKVDATIVKILSELELDDVTKASIPDVLIPYSNLLIGELLGRGT